MTSPRQVMKSVGPKLVPFFKTLAIYFVLFIPVERPSFFAMIIKCLPVVSLVFFVLLHGMSLGDEYAFSRRITIGLLFSCIGDACLVWQELFVHGMASFAVGHLFYIAAFGMRPLNLQLGVIIYLISAVGVNLLLPNLDPTLLIGLPVYTFILMTMVWRAMARVQFFEELWTWTKLCSCAGGLLFAISDAFIGFHFFYSPIPHSQVLIMTTYYAAQLGIALSVVDSKASYMKDQKLLHSKNDETQDPCCHKMGLQNGTDLQQPLGKPAIGVSL